jgi:histidinol-phosphate aminotransferase
MTLGGEKMDSLTRRNFVGGLAAAAGTLTLRPGTSTFARARSAAFPPADDYDALAKLSFNENPYGPPESVMQAMTQAFKYANRYGYPDGDIVAAIAAHHGVRPENILLGAGSSEILDAVGSALLGGGKKVLGVAPTFGLVYQHATAIKSEGIELPLQADYCQDIPALVKTANDRYREIGFVYLCNPNNPTGRIVTSSEIKQLLDGIPAELPVLIDEAYHHFVDNPDYATSVPYVLQGRPVIVTRTFSKIAALAGMRLGYGVAPAGLVQQMSAYTTEGINAVVKWGGVAALKDTESQARVKRLTLELRKNTTDALTTMGYSVIPSDTNFFMVDLRRPIAPVIAAFRARGVLVGRPFPPMTQHLRVSIGTADEMQRFMSAFRQVLA